MLRSPPPQKGAPAIVPRTFLRRTDPCFEQLCSRDQATEDLMKIGKLIPGALNAISNMASGASSPGPANPTPNLPPGGGGVGGGGGGKDKGKGKGANKRNADGLPKTDGSPSSPPGKAPGTLLLPGALASICSWNAQVLTIKREVTDSKTRHCEFFRRASLTWASFVRQMELRSMTTVGSLSAHIGCRRSIVSAE